MFPKLAVTLALCLLSGGAMGQEMTDRPVKLMTLMAQQNAINREFYGQVVARQTVDLAFQVGGQVVDLQVVEGTRLATGDLIARLDLDTFQLRLDQAKLEKEQADRRLDRQQALSRAAVSEASLEDAQTAANLAGIAVRDAELALERATLTAPFDALVASREIANYTTVQAGTPVVRLHDMSETRIEIDVPELLFRRTQEQSDVELSAVFPGRTDEIPLVLREYEAETSPVGQTYTVTLALENGDPSILPGASATVIARLQQSDRVVLVPPSAVVIAPDRSTSVMVFEPMGEASGTVRRMAVDLRTLENGALALETPLSEPIEIVAAGANRLEDGQAVHRFAGFGD